MANVLTADQLNALAKQTGYTGGTFSSVGLPTVPTTLTSTNTQSNPAITLPPPPSPTNYTGAVAGGNATLSANSTALTPSGAVVDPKTGQLITPPPTEPDATSSSNSSSILDYIKNLVKPPSASTQYATDYAQSGIAQQQADYNLKQQAVLDAQGKYQGLAAQLQGLNAEATSIPIQLQQDYTGRGATASGLAPIQADQLRANALKAIPIQVQALTAQAEVAQAQGNAQLSQSILQQAQDHLDKVFQIHQTDATNQYNYQNNLIDKAYQYASAEQQKQLEAQKATLATNNSQYNAFINDVRAIASTATASGQGSIASQITQIAGSLNPNSKTFVQDFQSANAKIAKLQGSIVPKASSTITTPRGTITSGTLNYSPQDQTEDSQALESSRGQDGYVDPTLYQNLYKLWIQHGGQLEDFLKTYPPKNYVNPANTWLPSFLMPPKSQSSSTITNPFQ